MKQGIAAACAAITLWSANASAQEASWLEQKVPAPAKAFELSVSTAYTQGFGELRDATSLPDVAAAGIGLGLGLGYRLDPRWDFSLQGQYQELNANRASGARGVTMTAAAAYHIRPGTRLDPWVEAGAGYRMLWETQEGPAPTIFTQGIQLLRVRVGADVRLTQDIGVGPFIGADVTSFIVQDGNSLEDPGIATFILAGVQGRFDFGGERTKTIPRSIARR